MNKSQIRKSVLKRMSLIDSGDRDKRSRAIAHKLIELNEIKRAKNILLFLSYKDELNTDYIFKELRRAGKRIYTTRVVKGSRMMEIKPIDSLDGLVISSYGIREPSADIKSVDPSVLDVIISPGVCFDSDMGRMGYGGGYYDTLFDRVPDATRIGVCLREQIIDEIPMEAHDYRMDIIVYA